MTSQSPHPSPKKQEKTGGNSISNGKSPAKRPRGNTPKGEEWDNEKGEYVSAIKVENGNGTGNNSNGNPKPPVQYVHALFGNMMAPPAPALSSAPSLPMVDDDEEEEEEKQIEEPSFMF